MLFCTLQNYYLSNRCVFLWALVPCSTSGLWTRWLQRRLRLTSSRFSHVTCRNLKGAALRWPLVA